MKLIEIAPGTIARTSAFYYPKHILILSYPFRNYSYDDALVFDLDNLCRVQISVYQLIHRYSFIKFQNEK
jgi:hypothetical protein